MDQFDDIVLIGAGSYGKVYKARRRNDGRDVALKKVKKSRLNGVHNTTIREIGILKQLNHPNIVSYIPHSFHRHFCQHMSSLLDVISQHHSILMIFEYMPSDLKAFINRNNAVLDERRVQRVMFQLVKGVAYLHSRRILHRDLKSNNILIDSTCKEVKIADFGLARSFSLPSRAYTHEVVTLWYRAPEILLGMQTYSFAIDMWSLGCIFTELVLGEPICRGKSEIDQLLKYFEVFGTPNEQIWPGVENLPFYIEKCPQWKPRCLATLMKMTDPRAIDLLSRMLTYDPRKRISAAEALEHSYFHGMSLEILDHSLQPTTIANIRQSSTESATLAIDFYRSCVK